MLHAGERVVHWTVLQTGADARALCRCDCGKELWVPISWLLAGVSTSCGCRKSRAINLSGQRFGHLLDLEPLVERARDHSLLWRCRCDCGKVVTVSSNKLRMGRRRSCGLCIPMDPKAGKRYVNGTCLENLFSETTPKNNTSGRRGVYQKRGKWCAYIGCAGNIHWLGTYDYFEDAVRAREAAEQSLKQQLTQASQKDFPEGAEYCTTVTDG